MRRNYTVPHAHSPRHARPGCAGGGDLDAVRGGVVKPVTCSDAKAMKPWTPRYRNSSRLPAGWYFRDDRGVLDGPYTTRLDCEHFLMEAKQEFPRS